VRAGLSALLATAPGIGAVLLAPCDQPGLTPAVALRLAAEHRRTGLIAAARYAGRNGAPAVFGARHFQALLALTGDEGARALLNADASGVSPLDMEELAADFDYPGDHARWSPGAH
jgi:molybdenum cofactor cytidylyltransferase